MFRRHQVDIVARRAADRVERLHQRHAGGEHRRERARPARDGRLLHQLTEHRQAQHQAVHENLHRERALPRLEKAPDRPTDHREDDVPVVDEPVRDGHDHERRRGQIGAEAGEHLLEGRDHENHDHRGDDERDRDDRDRIEERRLDLRLDGENLFLVGRQAIEQRLEYAGLLPRLHQVAEQRIEVQRVLAERRGERRAGLDVGLDLEQKLRHRRVRRALADDVERLQERHAGLHHRGELARKEREILLSDAAAAARLDLLDPLHRDALAAQGGVDRDLAGGAQFAAHRLAGLILAFPGEIEFFRAAFCGGRGCCCHVRNSLPLRAA